MKAKVLLRYAFFGLSVAVLSACQTVDRLQLKKIKETPETRNHALIYCSGTLNCEFERFDEHPIVDAQSRRLDQRAIKQGIVRLNAGSLKDPQALYLSVPAGLHEVVVRFYPISEEKAETINVIHRFEAKKDYRFLMFRDRSSGKKSLLDASAPEPLCVDLLQEQQTIRRFCKPYNVLNGLGEFVEQKNLKTR
jgi:hypothetical protein